MYHLLDGFMRLCPGFLNNGLLLMIIVIPIQMSDICHIICQMFYIHPTNLYNYPKSSKRYVTTGSESPELVIKVSRKYMIVSSALKTCCFSSIFILNGKMYISLIQRVTASHCIKLMVNMSFTEVAYN